MNNRAVILISGGLDSLVALGYCLSDKKYNVELGITFDYGQKSADKEIEASKKICDYYKIEHRVIKLDWLKDITKTSLVSDDEIPTQNLHTKESAESVWVPNRNSLFLNIAGCFCDSFGYEYIIYGANKDEASTFPDNTEEFREQISKLFQSSTLVKPQVVAPLINYTKDDIVKIAVDKGIPLELVWSCYSKGDKHCGQCESCNYLKKALITNHKDELIDKLFQNEN